MDLLSCDIAALAVAVIFYTWRAYQGMLARQRRTLRQRVALLLWTMANQVEDVAEDDLWVEDFGHQALPGPLLRC